jgi:hypothetical protein
VRAVADSNVYISALNFGGIAEEVWPVEVWLNGFDTGPFEKTHHESRCKDLWHFSKFGRLGIERRDSL